MQFDKYINDKNGATLASYGPRTLVVDLNDPDGAAVVEEVEPDKAGFWGVYVYDAEGCATWIGDAFDENSAATFARLAALRVGVRRLIEELTEGA